MERTRIRSGAPLEVLASFDRYVDAQRLVDRLADDGFPVELITIVGRDLRLIERVTGRVSLLRATLGGALAMMALGAGFGLLFGLVFAPTGVALVATVLYWVVAGGVIGAAFGAVSYHLFNRGERDFSSVTGIEADRYEVLVAASAADDARRRLGGVPAHPDGRAG